MIATEQAAITLRLLNAGDSAKLHRLLQDNRLHLTGYGDYRDQVSATLDCVHSELCAANDLRFGIYAWEELIGRIDLVPVDPPRYGLGYWLAKGATGQGYATAALRALIQHARSALGATDIYAGVTLGNAPSEALLVRTGFAPVARFDTYARYHRPLV